MASGELRILEKNKAVYTTTPVAGGWAGAVMSWAGAVIRRAGPVTVNELGRGNNEFGRAIKTIRTLKLKA